MNAAKVDSFCAVCNEKITTETEKSTSTTKCCCQRVCYKCASTKLEYCPYCCGRFMLDQQPGNYVSSCIHDTMMVDCTQHQRPFEYFCTDCNCGLCSDCIFEQITQKGSVHSSHKIKKLDELLQESIPKLKEAREILKNSIFKTSTTMRLLDREIAGISAQSEGVMMQMHESFRSVIEDAKKPIEEKEMEVTESMKKLFDLAQEARKCVCDSKEFLSSEDQEGASSSLMAVIQRIDSLQRDIDSFDLKVVDFPEPKDELEPQFQLFDVVLPNFALQVEKCKHAKKDEDKCVYSKPFRLYDVKWKLKVFPAGNMNGTGTHVSAFVELIDGIKGPVNMVYQIEIINGSRSFKKQYKSVFQLLDSWGWTKLIPINDALTYVREDDSLLLRVSLKPETFKEAVKILEYQNKERANHLQKMQNLLRS